MPISVNVIKIPVEAEITPYKKSLLAVDVKIINIRVARMLLYQIDSSAHSCILSFS
jgi:hypothetical protein